MRKFTLLMALTACISLLQAQTSSDYIFGVAGSDWTTGVQGTQVTSGVFQWQFTAATTGDQFFKLGETAASTDASGFWVNGDGADMNYTGAGVMWDVYYKANMGDGGAVKFAATTGNFYIIQARKNSVDNNAKFAVFESPSAIATIASVTQAFTSPNLTVTVNASVAPAAVQKFWVRYTKDNWATSAMIEATVTGTAGTAVIDATGADKVEYYVFTTVQAPAGFTDYDFYTVSLNNNGGKNYAYYAPMVGDYYIPNIPTGKKGFALLSKAANAINSGGVAGNINLLINGDINEPTNFGLSNTTDYTITIRPDDDIPSVITFEQLADNGASSGNIIIGLPNIDDWNSLGVAKNIIIDGFAPGGNTRQLTFQNKSVNVNTCKPIHIIGKIDNVIVKNCNLYDNTNGSSAFGVVSIRVRNSGGVDFIPNNITVDNCIIKSTSNTAAGIFVSNSGTPVGRPVGLVFKNNFIEVLHRAVSLNYAGTSSVLNNEIKVNQTTPSMASFAIGGTSGGMVSTTVSGNKIIQLGTANIAGAGNGIRAIQASAGGTWYIYNNFITGFATPSSGTTEVLGIRVGSLSYVYNNTIVLNNTSTTGGGTTPTACIVTYSATSEFKNNILISNEDDFASYCIYGKAISDYNTFYLGGTNNSKLGFATVAYASLQDWQTGTSQDANSKFKNVYFASATDLSIAGTSVNDPDLAAPALAAVTADIFGTARFSPLVYKGAHEASDLNQPAPTKVFTVTAPVGTEKVYIAGSFTGKNWDITNPHELTATEIPYEFTGTFACADGVEYKYLNGLANWDYLEATAPGASLANNRTYNSSDNIPYWFASPKVKLNVSFPEGSPIPSNLFVKGSWDSWATGIALTASSTPLSAPGAQLAPVQGVSFTGTIGDGTISVIYSNAEYKFYTTDMADPNWEVFTNNRLASYPLMNDVIASFTTPLTATGFDQPEMDVRIIRTQSGITAEFDGSANVELYSINGAMIDKTVAYGSYTRDLNPGAYIIRINGKATKFIR